MKTEELKAALDRDIAAYLETQPTTKDEWYAPVRDMHEGVLQEFMAWKFADLFSKEARRQRRAELLAELADLDAEFGAQNTPQPPAPPADHP